MIATICRVIALPRMLFISASFTLCVLALLQPASAQQQQQQDDFTILQATNGWDAGYRGPTDAPTECAIATNLRSPFQLLIGYSVPHRSFAVFVSDERWNYGPGDRLSLEVRSGAFFAAQSTTLLRDLTARIVLPRAEAERLLSALEGATRIAVNEQTRSGIRLLVGSVSLDTYNALTSETPRDRPNAGSPHDEFVGCLRRAGFIAPQATGATAPSAETRQ